MGIVKRRKQPHLFRDSEQHPQATTHARSTSNTRRLFLGRQSVKGQTLSSGQRGGSVPQPTKPEDGEDGADVEDEGIEGEDGDGGRDSLDG